MRINKSRVLLIFCLCFIVGIAIHSIFSPDERVLHPFTLYVVFLILSVIGILVFCHWKLSGIWCLGFGIFLLGFFRYAQSFPIVNERHILHYLGQEIMIRGVVDTLPREREKTTAYVIKIFDIQRLDLRNYGDPISVKGKLLLATEHFPAYQYGDLLAISCTPEPLNEYEQYYRREGVVAKCAFPRQIFAYAKVRRASPRTILYQIRETFDFHLRSLFPDPYGGLLAGLLYGDTGGLSKDLKEDFRTTGISHITALSGYNVTILAKVLIYLLIFFWFTRKQALPIALLLILGFVILTGAEASVVRAAIMGFLILGAKGIGRKPKMHVALACAGAIMLAFNPYLLRYDLGFQLSFLATIALIWFSDDLAKYTWLRRLPKFLGIREAGAASTAAILFTAPLLFYTTGMLGPLSLLVNILVVPIVPFAMAVGFIAVAMDFLFHPLGIIISWVTRVPLGYIIGVAEYFSRFGAWHWAMNAITAIVMFVIIVLWIWLWKKKLKHLESRNYSIQRISA